MEIDISASLAERLAKIDLRLEQYATKLDQYAIAIAKLEQKLNNNSTQRKSDWQKIGLFVGWFLTLLGLLIAVILSLKQ